MLKLSVINTALIIIFFIGCLFVVLGILPLLSPLPLFRYAEDILSPICGEASLLLHDLQGKKIDGSKSISRSYLRKKEPLREDKYKFQRKTIIIIEIRHFPYLAICSK